MTKDEQIIEVEARIKPLAVITHISTKNISVTTRVLSKEDFWSLVKAVRSHCVKDNNAKSPKIDT